MANMPEEYGYFWRRICVIACEDIGSADDMLVKFVVACATIFSARNTGPENLRLLSFLAEQMCDLPIRSRIYCSYETVSIAANKGLLPSLEPEDEIILDVIVHKKKTVEVGNSWLHEWQKKNNWRTGGLLRYVGLSLPLKRRSTPIHCLRPELIFDLPSYCYDAVHQDWTRGFAATRPGSHGAEAIRDFFQRNRVNAPHKVLGEALFTVEGGREKCELVYPSLRSLEQRIFARRFGLPFDEWLRLCDLTREALENGVIDRLREEILRGSMRRQICHSFVNASTCLQQQSLSYASREEECIGNTTN